MHPQKDWKYFSLNFFIIFIPLWIFFSAFLIYIYSEEIKIDSKALRWEEEGQVRSKVEAIAKDYTSISSDLMMISKMHEMQKVFDGDTTDIHYLESDLLYLSRIKKMYDQVRYLDENGIEILRINYNQGNPSMVPVQDLQNKSKRYYFKDTFAIHENEIFVSPLDLNIENGEIEVPFKPMTRIGTPVFDSNGKKRGILLLNFFGDFILHNFESANTAHPQRFSFLNPQGYWLKGPEVDDEWGFMFADKQDRTFGNKYPDAWEKIQASDTGQFKNENGLFTFKTVYPLSEYHKSRFDTYGTPSPNETGSAQEKYYFKVVSHVPRSILQQHTQNISKQLLRFYAILFIVMFAGSWIFAHFRELRRRLESSREDLIKELQTALDEVQTLQGILPICSFCKKIRNDEGYYEQLEGYFLKHSEVGFTHTICPDCVKKEYPDVYESLKKENKI